MSNQAQITNEPVEQSNQITNESADQLDNQESYNLTVNDLLGFKTIIDIATQRGAFKAPELESVGKLYNKLSKFLEAVSKKEGQQ